jgi:hypothetical protein
MKEAGVVYPQINTHHEVDVTHWQTFAYLAGLLWPKLEGDNSRTKVKSGTAQLTFSVSPSVSENTTT